jgi:transcriptional regulator with XRE-family HTH domain
MAKLPPVGKRVRRLRRAAGITLRELASRAGLDLSTVHKLEQGRIDNPRLDTLVALANALGVGVAALVEGAGDARAPGNPPAAGRGKSTGTVPDVPGRRRIV